MGLIQSPWLLMGGSRLPIPALDLNFLSGALDPSIAFTRAAGPATYFDSSGTLRTAAVNLLTNSQAINSWPTKTDITVVDNNTTSPDGTANASRVTEGVAGNAFATSNLATVAAGATVTGSVFVKRGNTDWFKLIVADTTGAANGLNVYVNIATGTIGTVSARGTATGVSGSVQSIGNGWYRVVGTCTLPGGSTTAGVLCASATGDNNATRVNNAQYYLWGGQVEVGTNASTYIPTTTAASGAARFDYDPATLQPRGLLIEEARTNILLNSATLGTQSVAVTAVPWALSFYDTGTIALSGAYTGSLVGAGPFPARASLIFTPAAGTLTLTVSGSVRYAQLE